MGQVGGVFAAPSLQGATPFIGVVQSITLETDAATGVATAIVDVIDDNLALQRVRISQETATALGLVVLDEDGKPVINELALGGPVEIDPATVIPDQEKTQHPVGSALATFFSDIAGLDYEAVMTAQKAGIGFGVIAQALWLTKRLAGNSEIFKVILDANQTGDYSAFILDDGTTPLNWGQLRKAIADENTGLGIVISDKDNNGNGNGNGNKDKDKDKDKDNNGNGNGNGSKK